MTNTALITAMTTATVALCDFEGADFDDLDALDNLRNAEDQLLEAMPPILTIDPLRPLAVAICELIENAIH